VRRLLDPVPRLEAAQILLEAGVRVAGDISDGLPQELRRICEPAGLGAEIDLDALPVAPSLDGEAAWLAVSASEDFELICAAAASTIEDCARRLRQGCGLSLTAVGRLTRQPGIRVLRDGRAIRVRGSGYEHFR
jgi:thiamine-monophosphate kinase